MSYRKKAVSASRKPQARKTKFQADLAPADDRMVRALKQELQLASNTDFLMDAVALFGWAVSERRMGRRILSESAGGDRNILLFAHLERVAPELSFPHVEIEWSEGELEALARLVSAQEPAKPTPTLVKALRG